MYKVAEATKVVWVWRSLVACLNGVQEAGSSNLLTQTTQNLLSFDSRFFVMSKPRHYRRGQDIHGFVFFCGRIFRLHNV